MSGRSRVFSYGGEVGVFCGTAEPAFRYTAKKRMSVLICPIGPVFRLYNVEKGFRYMSQSARMPSDIVCLAADAMRVFASDGKSVCSFHLSKQIERTYPLTSTSPVWHLLPFGDTLLGVDAANAVTVWQIGTGKIEATFELDPEGFRISTALHPATYVNKVLFGSHQGQLRLINTRTGKLLFTFKGCWGSGRVTCLEQSTAVDVIAVGLVTGELYLHDIRRDETLMSFKQDFGPVTHLGFRTDARPLLISGSPTCDISVWDLEKQKLVYQEEKCHGVEPDGSDAKLICLFTFPNEPIFISACSNNSLKSWIFDQPDDSFRMYHALQGHSSPPTLARFHGCSTDEIVISTGAADSTVKMFSTSKLTKYYNMGTAGTMARKLAKKRGLTFEDVKLPPVTGVASDSTRESGWDNVVCTHKNDVRVTTWTTRRMRRGSHLLAHERFSKEPGLAGASATCCCVTACGNFALIGYSSGHVDLYNIQSGKFRGSLRADFGGEIMAHSDFGGEMAHSDFGGETAHSGAVIGVVTDALNSTAVTAGEDSELRFWASFLSNKKSVIDGKLGLKAVPTLLKLHRESRLICVALSDLSLILVELNSRKVVRNFADAHEARITDAGFSASAYWLLSASADCTVKTWDIPSGQLVDILVCADPCTSLDMSPVDNLLVTTHTQCKGLRLWVNRTLYGLVSLAPIDYLNPDMDNGLDQALLCGGGVEKVVGMEIDKREMQQIGNLLTVSNLPPSRWANLMNLDVIRQRNKPKEPPKKPKAAPFFLPTIAGVNPKWDLPAQEVENKGSKILNISADGFRSDLCKLLAKTSNSGEGSNFSEPFEFLKTLGPSRIENEIQSLSPLNGGSVDVLNLFFRMMSKKLSEKRDFDLAQSYLSLALRVHRELIGANDSLRREVEGVKVLTDQAWENLDADFDSCLALIQYFGSAVLS